MKYLIRWMEKHAQFAKVEADSPEEALAKANAGRFIEGSYDAEPGLRCTPFKIEPEVDPCKKWKR